MLPKSTESLATNCPKPDIITRNQHRPPKPCTSAATALFLTWLLVLFHQHAQQLYLVAKRGVANRKLQPGALLQG